MTFSQYFFPFFLSNAAKKSILFENEKWIWWFFLQPWSLLRRKKKSYQCRTDWVVPNPIPIYIYTWNVNFWQTNTPNLDGISVRFHVILYISFLTTALSLISLTVVAAAVVWSDISGIIIIVSIHFVCYLHLAFV